MEELVPWKVLIPAGILLVLVGATMGMGGTTLVKTKEIRKINKKYIKEERRYIEQVDSLNELVYSLKEQIDAIDSSIVHIIEVRDETFDSLMQLDTNDKLEFLSNRFGISTNVSD